MHRNFLLFCIYIFLDPPGHPVITGYTPGEPIKKGSRVSLSCKSEGGNPPATLTWYREGERIDSSYTDREDGSTNTYEFIAQVNSKYRKYDAYIHITNSAY